MIEQEYVFKCTNFKNSYTVRKMLIIFQEPMLPEHEWMQKKVLFKKIM
jgi:hypothetical protein